MRTFQKLCESNPSGKLRSIHQCSVFVASCIPSEQPGTLKLSNFHPSCSFFCRAYQYITIFPSYVIALCITHSFGHFLVFYNIIWSLDCTIAQESYPRQNSSVGVNQVSSYHGSTVCTTHWDVVQNNLSPFYALTSDRKSFPEKLFIVFLVTH